MTETSLIQPLSMIRPTLTEALWEEMTRAGYSEDEYYEKLHAYHKVLDNIIDVAADSPFDELVAQAQEAMNSIDDEIERNYRAHMHEEYNPDDRG